MELVLHLWHQLVEGLPIAFPPGDKEIRDIRRG
jgi:hypothetical protein